MRSIDSKLTMFNCGILVFRRKKVQKDDALEGDELERLDEALEGASKRVRRCVLSLISSI